MAERRASLGAASSFTDEASCALLELGPTRPVSSSACSMFSTPADSVAAHARLVEDYMSTLDLFPDPPSDSPSAQPLEPSKLIELVETVSRSSQTEQLGHPKGVETQTDSTAQESKEIQTATEEPSEESMEPVSQLDETPRRHEVETQTMEVSQAEMDDKQTQVTAEELLPPEDAEQANFSVEAKEPEATATGLEAVLESAAAKTTSGPLSWAEQEAWMSRVQNLRQQESPARWSTASRPVDPEFVAKRLGIDPHARRFRAPVVPPLDFRKVQVGEVSSYYFSASISQGRSSLTRTSSDGRLNTAFTEPLTVMTPLVSELSPEERYQLFVQRIRRKFAGKPQVSPFAKPLTLEPLKGNFALKSRRRKSSFRSAFSPMDFSGVPMMEQLHSHFHHHFHLPNDLPAVSDALAGPKLSCAEAHSKE